MRFDFDATGIGSVPFKDAKSACDTIFENFTGIPFWPQLPKRSFLENMYAQYSEHLPGMVIDEANKTIHLDTTGVAETIEEVYQNYLDNNVEFFRISEKFATGFYEFIERLSKAPKTIKYLKGHITGPISYGLQVTDENKKAIIHDRDLFELLTKTLSMKAKWQIRRLKKARPDAGVIIFIDEPYLVSIGSSYININREEAFARFDEVVAAIKSEGALAGLHCCGNTDWPLLLKRDLDILNFDAYNFSKEFSLYAADIKAFTARASIAWGIVPSSDDIAKESAKALAVRFAASLKMLADKGVDTASISSIVTPSCGVGTLEDDVARKVLETTAELSRILKKQA